MSFGILRIKEGLNKYSVPDFENISEKMSRYMELVLERNESINLTAITDKDEFVDRHLLDSVGCYGWPEIEKSTKIVDVGTGAGFPGIPLALCYPDKKFVLIDSLGKRVDFLCDVIKDMNLKNVSALHLRAEDAGRNADIRESFDLCVTRAVAPLNVLLEYTLPLVTTGGAVFAYKTIKAETEILDSSLALRLLGGSPNVESRRYGNNWKNGEQESTNINNSPYSLSIFVVEKISSTPKQYPRKAGTPKKIPL